VGKGSAVASAGVDDDAGAEAAAVEAEVADDVSEDALGGKLQGDRRHDAVGADEVGDAAARLVGVEVQRGAQRASGGVADGVEQRVGEAVVEVGADVEGLDADVGAGLADRLDGQGRGGGQGRRQRRGRGVAEQHGLGVRAAAQDVLGQRQGVGEVGGRVAGALGEPGVDGGVGGGSVGGPQGQRAQVGVHRGEHEAVARVGAELVDQRVGAGGGALEAGAAALEGGHRGGAVEQHEGVALGRRGGGLEAAARAGREAGVAHGQDDEGQDGELDEQAEQAPEAAKERGGLALLDEAGPQRGEGDLDAAAPELQDVEQHHRGGEGGEEGEQLGGGHEGEGHLRKPPARKRPRTSSSKGVWTEASK
jgi:hypothetical protein